MDPASDPSYVELVEAFLDVAKFRGVCEPCNYLSAVVSVPDMALMLLNKHRSERDHRTNTRVPWRFVV